MSLKPDQTRKEFITRTIRAGASVALAGTAGLLLHDRDGPSQSQESRVIQLPDYRVKPQPDMSLSMVTGSDRITTLRKSIEELGGINRFIQKGDTVLIKPNIAFASSPNLGATTHPSTVKTLAELCLKAGADRVQVLDNPINDPAGCYQLSGIEDALEGTGTELIFPSEKLFSKMTLRGGRLIKNWPVLYKPLAGATKVIGVAPVKNHHRSGASLTMKNWYGLLGGRRNLFHQDIHTIITELATMITPTLVILDGFDVMMTNGPTGGSMSDLVRKNTIIAGTDQVAVDTLGATLLGLGTRDLPFLTMAEKAGLGTTNYQSLSPRIIKI